MTAAGAVEHEGPDSGLAIGVGVGVGVMSDGLGRVSADGVGEDDGDGVLEGVRSGVPIGGEGVIMSGREMMGMEISGTGRLGRDMAGMERLGSIMLGGDRTGGAGLLALALMLLDEMSDGTLLDCVEDEADAVLLVFHGLLEAEAIEGAGDDFEDCFEGFGCGHGLYSVG